jgi:sugar phosphate permease
MNENLEKQNGPELTRPILQNWLIHLAQIFLYAIGISVIIAASFLFTGSFSAQAFSDRLFIGGIIVTAIGLIVFISMAGTRKNMGIPTIAKNVEDARKIMDHTHILLEKTEKRYDVASQVWLVGLSCLFLSVLFYYLLSIFKI